MIVTIIETGVANTASVQAALRRCGVVSTLTTDSAAVERAECVVLPGVGSFRAGMEQLQRAGLCDSIRSRIESARPTLAICLGLQLLCESSEESPGVEGLGVIPGRIERFSRAFRIPQLGWNTIVPSSDCRLLQRGAVYFANSYRLTTRPEGWSVATAEYGGQFVGAMERGCLMACQFHPELSGALGLELLQSWLARAVQECVKC